jgi:hypothetical protein
MFVLHTYPLHLVFLAVFGLRTWAAVRVFEEEGVRNREL